MSETLFENGARVPFFFYWQGVTEVNTINRDAIFGYRAYEDIYASVREGDWKLLAYRSGKLQLYNSIKDIKEVNNV